MNSSLLYQFTQILTTIKQEWCSSNVGTVSSYIAIHLVHHAPLLTYSDNTWIEFQEFSTNNYVASTLANSSTQQS